MQEDAYVEIEKREAETIINKNPQPYDGEQIDDEDLRKTWQD